MRTTTEYTLNMYGSNALGPARCEIYGVYERRTAFTVVR